MYAGEICLPEDILVRGVRGGGFVIPERYIVFG